ncbi:S10 family peptidase [Occallatibacter riparius]|uniref:Peptidase S10 n=1 Tax=Occallatibacter riparius TaxID=1002689 RepID=A0A9J7BPG5_9BACT|nr:peptidase S10 [Occallatibacter riparius]UWZ83642.1 peptidase S10 [Occallatibacter riparius]
MRFSGRLALCLLSASLLASTVFARADDDKKKDESKPAEKPAATEVTTQGSVDVGGQHILYNAIAGTITVGATDVQDAQLGLDGKPEPGSQLALNEPKEAKDAPPTARMSYFAYFKRDAKAEDRPVTFFYNGGPGSSTVWLHMGSLGPKHVATSGDQHLAAAPYKMVDNANSLLDVSDLVFVDMPGTGFGRLMGKDPEKAFWGVDEDANAFARFIVRFITKYSRWNSPKYIFGESYGTTRSAVLADVLENNKNIDLNGVILLSQIFNFSTDIDFPQGNPGVDLPYVLALPTYAATAWYHKKLPQQAPALEPFLKEVEDFAMGAYSHALAQGTDISAEEKQATAEKLHNYTGLPTTYILKANLRVNGGEFEKTLQDDQDLTTGRLDTRYSGPSIDPLSQFADYDPQSSAISSAYVSIFNDYVRKDLKYGEGQTYLPEALFGGAQWSFLHRGNPIALNVAVDLAEAMKTNPRLKVMVNGGYYDLATPFFAAIYEEKHLPIPQSLAKNIEYSFYESGHMVYVRDESLKQLHDRVAAFITKTQTDGK